jgi:LDH2 family malate/lactate/ureidoglycolate dehydrogenase
MATYRIVAPRDLETFCARVFERLDTPADVAQEVAAHLVRANLAGHDSHGVIRVPQYAMQIRQGVILPGARPSVVREHGAALLVDAGRGFGQFATRFALERALERAATLGVAAVAIRNANHIGRLGDYCEAGARQGFVVELTAGAAGPGVGGAAPFGGATRFLGTNPWAIGIPAPGQPIVADFATTVIAEGKVRVARAKREPLPPGCIVDKEGRPSTDPEDYYAGGALLHAGGHKGYGLSLAAALLGGLAAIGQAEPSLAGTPRPANASTGDRIGGVFLVAFDPGAFGDAGEYLATVGRVARAAKAVPPAPGVAEVLLPGEPEARTRQEREHSGIAIPDDTWQAIAEVAAGVDLEMPPFRAAP